MNKIIGWFLVIFFSTILFVFGVFLLCVLFDFPEPTANSTSDKVTSFLGAGLFMLLSIWGLGYGWRTIKKGVPIATIAYNKVLDISLKGKIEFKAYRNLMLGLIFKKKLFFWMSIIIILSVIQLLASGSEAGSMHYFYALFMIVLVVVFPVSVFLQIKKLYNTDAIFKEILTYHVTNASIQIIGDTVNSTQQWTHFIKIKDTQHFYLFYSGAMVATLLEKRLFSEEELNEFAIFIKSLNIPKE
ncbi:YcxB family protein [Cytophaga aurantiaca]|uniref:YcxB family protein n=1 Tax=Cytophaga aurantiaca TaxID=29530 RepID=UPI0003682ABF|nr:YcxB family protein [Cytophaga aurantiaca]